ncbi:unnamed protein product [Caenorhabditis nigoni]
MVATDIDNCPDKFKSLQCSGSSRESTAKLAKSFDKLFPVKTHWDNSPKIKGEIARKKDLKKKEEKSTDTPTLAEASHNFHGFCFPRMSFALFPLKPARLIQYREAYLDQSRQWPSVDLKLPQHHPVPGFLPSLDFPESE